MRTQEVVGLALFAGLAACSGTDRNPGQGVRPSDTSGTATTTPAGENAGSSSAATSSLSEAEVRQSLSEHGYGNVANLHRAGDDWVGTATDSDGQPVNFDMNPGGILVVMP